MIIFHLLLFYCEARQIRVCGAWMRHTSLLQVITRRSCHFGVKFWHCRTVSKPLKTINNGIEIFTHLKLFLAVAMRNFKWVNIAHANYFANSFPNSVTLWKQCYIIMSSSPLSFTEPAMGGTSLNKRFDDYGLYFFHCSRHIYFSSDNFL